MYPLDSTNKVIFQKADIQPWHDGDQKAKFSADLYDIMFNEYGWTEAEIFDLGAAVIIIEPDACDFVPLHLDVITEDGDNLGQTVLNSSEEPNFNVCLDPNADLIMRDIEMMPFIGSGDTFGEPEPFSIGPVVGSWSGTVVNNSFEMEINITIEEACQVGKKCGNFDIPTISCSGALSWVGMDDEMFEFESKAN